MRFQKSEFRFQILKDRQSEINLKSELYNLKSQVPYTTRLPLIRRTRNSTIATTSRT
jgi:hypothetical protein